MLNIKAKEAPIQIDEPDPEMENVYQEESTGGMVEEPAPISSEPSKKKATTMKVIVWVCLLNGLAWVWCSYILAESRSQKAFLRWRSLRSSASFWCMPSRPPWKISARIIHGRTSNLQVLTKVVLAKWTK